MAEIDWNQLRKSSSEVLTGDYALVFIKADAANSQNGKPQIKCQLKVETGPSTGRTIYHTFTISAESSAAMRMFFTQMAALGLDVAFFAGNPTVEQVAAALLGKRAVATLEPREWQGVPRDNIKAFKLGAPAPVGIAPAQKLPDGDPF